MKQSMPQAISMSLNGKICVTQKKVQKMMFGKILPPPASKTFLNGNKIQRLAFIQWSLLEAHTQTHAKKLSLSRLFHGSMQSLLFGESFYVRP